MSSYGGMHHLVLRLYKLFDKETQLNQNEDCWTNEMYIKYTFQLHDNRESLKLQHILNSIVWRSIERNYFYPLPVD